MASDLPRTRGRSQSQSTPGRESRASLKPRTRELYEWQLRNHIDPYLGAKTLDKLTPEAVRSWHQQLLNEGRSVTVAAKSYRLLRAVLNTALKEDQLIAQNPCRIPGYDREGSAERSVVTIRQVFALSQLVERRYAALVLFAAFSGLRWGELVALRRSDLDLERELSRSLGSSPSYKMDAERQVHRSRPPACALSRCRP